MRIETTQKAKRVYELLSQVPQGRVTTYGALAKASGLGRAYRLVGAILRSNPYSPYFPCHRVVMSDGRLGGYHGSDPEKIKIKASLLALEGVEVQENKVINFKVLFFDDFKCE
ncbi:MAG: MGMT family protein [Methanomassiliicoccales archaeon]